MSSLASLTRKAQREADAFTAAHPVGTPVRYWTWTREVMTLRQVVLAVADRIDAANTGVSDERFDRWSDALRSAVYG